MLDNGILKIIAKKEDSQYTSTKITTKGKKQFQYGKIETRIKLPGGAGVWPAFWMLGYDIDNNPWPDCGEIDIMEYVGRIPNTVHNTLHNRSSFGNSINTRSTVVDNTESEFHTYGLEWTNTEITFFIDEKPVYIYSPSPQNIENWPYNKPFYLIINLAIGGNFGGDVPDDSIFPTSYEIDYVRLFQKQ